MPGEKMASKLLMLFVPLAAFLFQRLFQPSLQFGDHRETVYNHVPGTCRPVEGVVHGSEDIVRTRDGLAFISTGLIASPVFNPDPWYLQRKGKILLFNLKNPEDGVRELKIEPREKYEDLQPHGLGLYENQAGEIRLFVVNHLKDGERVEIFRYVRPEGKLKLIRSVQDPLLYSVNDVVAMGTDAFFATNDHYCRAPWAKKLERFLGPAWSNVVYYNGSVASVAADGFSVANSVVTPPSGEVVYVSDSLQQDVKVFRPRPDHSLELQSVIHLFTGVDNLNICPDTGDLWVAAHPSVTDIFKHIQDRRHLAPSQVLRIQDPAGASPEVTELYANDGRQLNGSSAAVVYNRRLLIGTVHDTLLYCDVTVPL
ncbi:PREDICTED: serum paraoxonase/arylesterase 2-like [Branchiostoma belcheri]|uniref:Paraoxonase n=1 Tax=Branchiostoma belcheri TaxID=7741 RepID=A0A6P4ZR52_BRABE|nr:PREDICTED: serum paraoxonase/arylesterase 2-like [Branchiostoma belcheri]